MECADETLPSAGRIVTTGTRFVYAHAGAFVRSGALYVILITALYTAGDVWIDFEILFDIASILVLASFSWIWHRAYFEGPETVSWKGSLEAPVDKEQRKAMAKARFGFAWRAVALNLILGLFLATADVSPAIMIPAIVVLVYVTLRVLPSFASYACGQPMTWAAVWRLTIGAGWRLVAAIGILFGLLLIAFFFFALVVNIPFILVDVSPLVESILLNAEVAVLMLVFVAVGSVCNAFVFAELTAHSDVFD